MRPSVLWAFWPPVVSINVTPQNCCCMPGMAATCRCLSRYIEITTVRITHWTRIITTLFTVFSIWRRPTAVHQLLPLLFFWDDDFGIKKRQSLHVRSTCFSIGAFYSLDRWLSEIFHCLSGSDIFGHFARIPFHYCSQLRNLKLSQILGSGRMKGRIYVPMLTVFRMHALRKTAVTVL